MRALIAYDTNSISRLESPPVSQHRQVVDTYFGMGDLPRLCVRSMSFSFTTEGLGFRLRTGKAVGAHRSGVLRISATSLSKIGQTPRSVFADASTKSEFIRNANTRPSSVDTWREDS